MLPSLRNISGFTLIEVMIALAILMLFLVPLLGSVTTGLQSVVAARNRSLGLRLAQDRMTEIYMTPIPDAEGTTEGDFGRDYPAYRWEMEAVKTPDLQMMEQQIPSLKAMEIRLQVLWDENGAEKSVELDTLILE